MQQLYLLAEAMKELYPSSRNFREPMEEIKPILLK
jgi:hypothetical protein